jgi:hypothetical protein
MLFSNCSPNKMFILYVRLLEREGYGKIDSPEGVDVIIFKKNN